MLEGDRLGLPRAPGTPHAFDRYLLMFRFKTPPEQRSLEYEVHSPEGA